MTYSFARKFNAPVRGIGASEDDSSWIDQESAKSWLVFGGTALAIGGALFIKPVLASLLAPFAAGAGVVSLALGVYALSKGGDASRDIVVGPDGRKYAIIPPNSKFTINGCEMCPMTTWTQKEDSDSIWKWAAQTVDDGPGKWTVAATRAELLAMIAKGEVMEPNFKAWFPTPAL